MPFAYREGFEPCILFLSPLCTIRLAFLMHISFLLFVFFFLKKKKNEKKKRGEKKGGPYIADSQEIEGQVKNTQPK